MDEEVLESKDTRFAGHDAIAFIEESETVGFAVVDLDGRFICVNQAYCQILNATWRQVIGTRYQEWTHERDLAADEAAAKELADGFAMRYGIVKTYIQRGSTEKYRREITGLLEVSAVWENGKCQRYRVRFSPFGQMEAPKTITAELISLLPIISKNWKTIGTALLVVASIFGGSEVVTRILSVINQLQSSSAPQP